MHFNQINDTRYAEHIARRREFRNSYQIVVENVKIKGYMADLRLELHGRVIVVRLQKWPAIFYCPIWLTIGGSIRTRLD